MLNRHFSYTAYGLVIASDVELPELAPLDVCEQEPDILMRLGAAEEPVLDGEETHHFEVGDSVACLSWRDVGRFDIRDGRQVLAAPSPRVSRAILRAFLLGPVLAIAMHQRGSLVLHASAVALDEGGGRWGAVGFLGDSGEGKSTIAAALHARGHRMITDDVLAISMHASQATMQVHHAPLVFPGPPELRLSAQAAAAVGQDASKLPIRASRERHVLKIAARETGGVPLRCLYVLESRNEHDVRSTQSARCHRAPATEAVALLGKHAYASGDLDLLATTRHFQRCCTLAAQIPVLRLSRPRDLRYLPEVAGLVERFHARVPYRQRSISDFSES